MPEFTTELSEYKGNPMISLMFGEKRILSFGLKKAMAIVACIEDIKKFVNDNKKED